MSEFHITCVRVGPLAQHPNADRLLLARVWDYPVCVGIEEFKEGDLAVYVPVDSLVPADDPRWAFLAKGQTAKSYDIPGGRFYFRIKAARLRGTFSMGLLTKAPDMAQEGNDYRTTLGIEKYEPPEPVSTSGEDERDPGILPVYDIEGLRRWPGVLEVGEKVVITEKLHGANGRWVFHQGRLFVASHTTFKRKPEEGNTGPVWWRAAEQYELEDRLNAGTDTSVALYGEVYGPVQDLKYGTARGALKLAIFDVLDVKERRWLDHDHAQARAVSMGIPWVPVLYRGPWSEDLRSLAEGQSTVPGADHVREGIVIRPLRERFHEGLGRVLLKLHGEGYLTRKTG